MATLKELWLGGQDGRLSPWEVAKALGLREASKELHGGQPNLPWIASRVTKIGGGHPSDQSLWELLTKIDAERVLEHPCQRFGHFAAKLKKRQARFGAPLSTCRPES